MIRLGYHYGLDLIYTDMVSVRRLHAYGVRQTGGRMCGRSATGNAKKAVNGDRVQKWGISCPARPISTGDRGHSSDAVTAERVHCPLALYGTFFACCYAAGMARQSDRRTTVPETEHFPVLFVSSLAIRHITAFFDFQNEKNFSFQVEDFRQAACCIGAASRPKEYWRMLSGGQQS